MSELVEPLPDYRLPDNVKPSHYRLDLITDLDDFNFTGEIWIKIDCHKPTDTIVLHALNLTIKEGEVVVKEIGSEKDSSDMKVVHQKFVSEHDFFVIKLDQSLKSNKHYLVYIPYSGELTQRLSGYYRSSFIDRKTNKTHWLGVTHFEPSDARRAFPCFDEPEFKAQFSIRLAHRDTLKAISNMPLVKNVPMKGRSGWEWDEFQVSVPMSTYLVAWLVSDFEYVEAPDQGNNVTFKIWSRKDGIDQTGLAKHVGSKVLRYYEELFDIDYPLPKQDMVSIPDFPIGAMENWGLITYRETDILYDPKGSSIHDKEEVASTISHELAHQWFGNLVTMKWWTDLWLKEGFATYIAALGVDHVYPEWNMIAENSIFTLRSVYELDSLMSSHPVSVKIGHPSEVREIFDVISYKKGSTIIKMMHNFLGNSFNKGISNFLKAHKYSSASQDDLWSVLTEQAHKDGNLPKNMTVKAIMDTWTVQTGFPLLTVTRNYENGTAKISQKRYLRIPSDFEDKSWWWIPLTYTTKNEADFNNTTPKAWMDSTDSCPFVINNLPIGYDQWLVLNIGLTGLFRVQYDAQNWKLISSTLNGENYKSIGPMNRAGIIQDAFEFAVRGDLPYETALELSSYLSRETELIPLRTGLLSLRFLYRMLKRTPGINVFKGYMKKIILPLYSSYKNLTETPSSSNEAKMLELVTTWACMMGIEECSNQVKSLYRKWHETVDLDNDNPIPTDLQYLVLSHSVELGNNEVWNKVWERCVETNYPAEQYTLLRALACSNDPVIIEKYLERSITDGSGVRKQDSVTVFSAIAEHKNGFQTALNFLLDKVNDIRNYHEGREYLIGNYLHALALNVISADELDKIKTFVVNNKGHLTKARLLVDQSLEKATANVKWHSDYYQKIIDLLEGTM